MPWRCRSSRSASSTRRSAGRSAGARTCRCRSSLALAALRLRRPVFTQWSREESIVGHHKRHRGRVHARWGADAEGRITVVEADCYLDAGAYNYTSNKVLANLHLTVAGPYEVPNARIDSHAVYTNNVPGGAFRGLRRPAGCVRRRDADQQARRPPRDRPGRAAPAQLRHRRQHRHHPDAVPAGRDDRPGDRRVRRRGRMGWPTARSAGADTDRHAAPGDRVGAPRPRVRLRVQERRLLLRLPGALRRRRSCCTAIPATSRRARSTCTRAAPRSARGRTPRSCRWPPRPPASRSSTCTGTSPTPPAPATPAAPRPRG